MVNMSPDCGRVLKHFPVRGNRKVPESRHVICMNKGE
jgi:hypothetical protein